ncbi:FIST C-terminal domain-containing protein [Kineosporia sp. J2-2]|uniref:FIST C-terminal domain-containing protein n=1 Tax=Kineosporia corallincola TaxID=2835133 RepID=A0ABS5TBU1_9ACTN|nr:FIST N-terminal domain-containing protein [Kineosporia corallincola]MBT0768544.1 FIST C-terminal domain-containing protein [Kineosporia corallincola]
MGQWTAGVGYSTPLPAWDGPSTLVMIFASGAVMEAAVAPGTTDTGPVAEVADTYSSSVVMGCSTAGEIFGETVEDGTVTVAVAAFDTTRLTLVHRDMSESRDSRRIGRDLAEELTDHDPALKGLFVLSDGLTANGAELAQGLSEGCRGRGVITGGLAGDGNRFDRTWVLADGRPRNGVVSVLGLSGPNVRIGHGAGGGWSILGPERKVTRSEGNVLYELDGQPALELYRTYLGALMGETPEATLRFPLSVRTPDGAQKAVVRTVQAFDETEQSLIFTGDVPQDAVARLMRANMDELVEGAGDAVKAAELIPGLPVLALIVSCIGRRAVLKQRTEDELETVLSRLPGDALVAGFYSYGEISPIGDKASGLLNQTLTITTIQELTP